jgi:hypothetical protein
MMMSVRVLTELLISLSHAKNCARDNLRGQKSRGPLKMSLVPLFFDFYVLSSL